MLILAGDHIDVIIFPLGTQITRKTPKLFHEANLKKHTLSRTFGQERHSKLIYSTFYHSMLTFIIYQNLKIQCYPINDNWCLIQLQ